MTLFIGQFGSEKSCSHLETANSIDRSYICGIFDLGFLQTNSNSPFFQMFQNSVLEIPVDLTGTGPPHWHQARSLHEQHATFRNYTRESISGHLLLSPALFVLHSIERVPQGICGNIGTRRPSQNYCEWVAKSDIEYQGTSSSHLTSPQPPLAFDSLHITSSIPQTYSPKLSRARRHSIRLPALKFQHSAFYDVVP